MVTWNEIRREASTLTFDCYGTLIDWEAGLRGAFLKIFGGALTGRMDALFETYNRIEAEVEGEGFRSYREVLAETVRRIARTFDLQCREERVALLAESLPQWAPFPDSREALRRLKERFRVGVLSNIDRDLFTVTARRLGVDFDFVITAEDVRSYKPAPAHFERLIEREGAERVIHVAQSLYHDGAPAEKLGLANVWINRYKQTNRTAVVPLAEFADLKSLADSLCG